MKLTRKQFLRIAIIAMVAMLTPAAIVAPILGDVTLLTPDLHLAMIVAMGVGFLAPTALLAGWWYSSHKAAS